MKPFKFSQEVQLVGPHGTCGVEVALSFTISPSNFSPGMAMIATRELQNTVERIMAEARKAK